jgi:NAD(P)-dependent dehydrogenase (short-subunit alcohol dehydrogenase family)
MDPQQPTALVNGANQGIGLETCRQLAALGYRVILTSRNEVGGRAAAKDLGVDHHRLDVTNADHIAALAADLRRESRAIDVLVNNAGISMDGFNNDVVRGTLAVNFFGALHVTEALLPLIPDGGNIVLVSSGMAELHAYSAAIRARFADPNLTRDQLVALIDEFIADVAAGRHEKNGWPSSAYRVSKAGLNALARVLARDLASRRIRVNAVCPGWVQTRMGGRSASRRWRRGPPRSSGRRRSPTPPPAASSAMAGRRPGEGQAKTGRRLAPTGEPLEQTPLSRTGA